MMLRSALRFFTRLPVGRPDPSASFHGVMVWLPVVGLIIGLIIGLAVWAAALVLPSVLCGVFGCFVWVAVTGGLHLDGVADCGDGMLVEAPREKRLVIMKDSRLGTFGGVALFFVLLFKAAALACLCESSAPTLASLAAFAGICVMAAVLGRSAVFAAQRLPSARPDGMGSMVAKGTDKSHGLRALALCVLVCAFNGWLGALAFAAALFTAWILLSAAMKRLGGVTGDVYGCLIELTECAVLTVCCI